MARDNGEYGLVAFASSGTRMLGNRSSGSGEAGLYVGDSPDADATLAGNSTAGSCSSRATGGTPPTDNTISGNLVLRNAPDLFWDETGSGNVFRRNLCRTSQPTGLCR